jgi:hypothetical protein
MADESVSNAVQNAQASEDMLTKYKRLLSMARSSLEANQATLATKDQQIAQLMTALEEERNKRMNTRIVRDDEGGQLYARRIITRVDIEGTIWILLEYDTQEDEWKSFQSEMALQDYIKRIPGVPLLCPQRCLSSEESSKLVWITNIRMKFSLIMSYIIFCIL